MTQAENHAYVVIFEILPWHDFLAGHVGIAVWDI